MRARVWAVAWSVAIACVGCQPKTGPPASSSSPSPAALADSMDTRTPLPLLPMMVQHQKSNMRDHVAAVQEIVAALAVHDYDAVESAAGRLGSSPEMGHMCERMGMGAAGFTAEGLAFHRTADSIAVAARTHDGGRVLLALDATLQKCVVCHERWKQRVVDDSTWARAAAETRRAAP